MIGTLRLIQSALCMLRRKRLTLLSPLPSMNVDSITGIKKTGRGECLVGKLMRWLECNECIVLGEKQSEQVEKKPFGNVDLKLRKWLGNRIADP